MSRKPFGTTAMSAADRQRRRRARMRASLPVQAPRADELLALDAETSA
jgi:hypothetical protein